MAPLTSYILHVIVPSTNLNMTIVVHFAIEWTQVAVRAKTCKTVTTFNTNGRLGKVEVILIGQLHDVMMTEEGVTDGKAMNHSNLIDAGINFELEHSTCLNVNNDKNY